jgi:hypothetical protein
MPYVNSKGTVSHRSILHLAAGFDWTIDTISALQNCSENNEHKQNPKTGLAHTMTISFSEQLI